MTERSSLGPIPKYCRTIVQLFSPARLWFYRVIGLGRDQPEFFKKQPKEEGTL